MTIRTSLAALALGTFLATCAALPSSAKNLAVPNDDPAVTLGIPDTWTQDSIDYGYSAVSPGKEIFFSVEYAGKKDLDGLLDTNEAWMKDHKINGDVKPQQIEKDFNGIKGQVFHFDTTDENGKTNVDFVLIPAGKSRVIMLTLWGTNEDESKFASDIDAIMGSVHPIP